MSNTKYQFNYALIGDRSQPIVIFLHGFMGCSHDFLEIIKLISAYYCCLIVDLPGHGTTEVTQDSCYQMSCTAMGIIELLNRLRISSCFLVGYSMGGRIALYLALHFPKYFKAVILESASPGLKTTSEREIRIRHDQLIQEKLQTQDMSAFLQQWYENPLFASFIKHPDYAQAIAQRLENNPIKLIKSLEYLGLGKQPSLWHKLEGNKVPLLLLVGELDSKFISINQEMANLCGQAKLIIIENSGHNIHFEQPNFYAGLVLNWLKNI